MARQENEAHEIAERIGEGEDFGRHAALGAAWTSETHPGALTTLPDKRRRRNQVGRIYPATGIRAAVS
jgi:hypothetical protein